MSDESLVSHADDVITLALPVPRLPIESQVNKVQNRVTNDARPGARYRRS
jgi:hypothetical protein